MRFAAGNARTPIIMIIIQYVCQYGNAQQSQHDGAGRADAAMMAIVSVKAVMVTIIAVAVMIAVTAPRHYRF